MRVTITVEDVVQEIEVRPDLLRPGMGEWQDATEMALLVAFGTAYRQATADHNPQTTDTGHVVPLSVVADPAEPVTFEASYDPEALVYDPENQDVDPAATPVDEVYVPADEQVTLSEEGFVPLDGEPGEDAQEEVAPSVIAEPCLCGHPLAWHVQENDQDYETNYGPCQMEWLVDEKDPKLGKGRCSCLRYSANVLPITAD